MGPVAGLLALRRARVFHPAAASMRARRRPQGWGAGGRLQPRAGGGGRRRSRGAGKAAGARGAGLPRPGPGLVAAVVLDAQAWLAVAALTAGDADEAIRQAEQALADRREPVATFAPAALELKNDPSADAWRRG